MSEDSSRRTESLLEQKGKKCNRVSMRTDLEFPPGIEFLQALHGLLSVHHRCHCGSLLRKGRRDGRRGVGWVEEEGDKYRIIFREKKKIKRTLSAFFRFTFKAPSSVLQMCTNNFCQLVYQAEDTYADPWVLEGLLSSDPLGWVDRQHLVDQVFGLWGDCVPLWGWELEAEKT